MITSFVPILTFAVCHVLCLLCKIFRDVVFKKNITALAFEENHPKVLLALSEVFQNVCFHASGFEICLQGYLIQQDPEAVRAILKLRAPFKVTGT